LLGPRVHLPPGASDYAVHLFPKFLQRRFKRITQGGKLRHAAVLLGLKSASFAAAGCQPQDG
jgi:hypothetical protein